MRDPVSNVEYKKIAILKAIRKHCLDCCHENTNEVKLCQSYSCDLYPFRFGKNPFNTRKLTEEQRQELSDRAKKNFNHDL